jgi:hypothetical protein
MKNLKNSFPITNQWIIMTKLAETFLDEQFNLKKFIQKFVDWHSDYVLHKDMKMELPRIRYFIIRPSLHLLMRRILKII